MVPETNMPVRFYLTPNRDDGSASILVAEPLDYEATRNFMLRVRAQNVAAVPLAAFTTVYVNLTGNHVHLSVLERPPALFIKTETMLTYRFIFFRMAWELFYFIILFQRQYLVHVDLRNQQK